MKKIVYITNIPSPYQIEWAKTLRTTYNVEFWFFVEMKNSASGRPEYWNIDMPNYCRLLPAKFQQGEFSYGTTLKKELTAFNPDIVWVGGAWYMLAWWQAYIWARKNKKKILAGPIEFNQSLYKFRKILRNKIIYYLLYSKVDVIFANAFIHYDYFRFALGKKNAVLFMNYDNYSLYLAHKVRKIKEEVYFMYGGAISRRLRVPELLSVFQKIVLNYPNARLIIGGYGPEKDKCINIVEGSEELSRTVSFHNVKSWDEIPEVYRKCDVLINVATYSPGSGVILAAVASGMGIISSITVNSTRHFVIDKYNGYIIENDEGLYQAMEKYLSTPELIEMHSQRSKDIGLSTLTFQEHLKDFNKVIEIL